MSFVPSRFDLTLLMCCAFNFNVCTKRKLVDGNACSHLERCQYGGTAIRILPTYWLWLFVEDLVIDSIHSGEVGHVGQENIDLNDIVNAAPSRFKDGSEVLQAMFLRHS